MECVGVDRRILWGIQIYKYTTSIQEVYKRMSLNVLAKKAYAGKGLSKGAFRSGPPVSNTSSRTRYVTERLPDVWKPVQNQSESERMHKAVVNYAKCWTLQKDDTRECSVRPVLYKDMHIRSSSDYISIFKSSKTCYDQEQVPQNNTC